MPSARRLCYSDIKIAAYCTATTLKTARPQNYGGKNPVWGANNEQKELDTSNSEGARRRSVFQANLNRIETTRVEGVLETPKWQIKGLLRTGLPTSSSSCFRSSTWGETKHCWRYSRAIAGFHRFLFYQEHENQQLLSFRGGLRCSGPQLYEIFALFGRFSQRSKRNSITLLLETGAQDVKHRRERLEQLPIGKEHNIIGRMNFTLEMFC